MRRLPSLVLPLVLAACAAVGPAVVTPGAPVEAEESRTDLARAFAERGWQAIPIAAVQPVGVVGEGTAYRVEGRRVVVFDYASAEEAAASAAADAERLLRLEAGSAVEVYHRPTLVVLTYGRAQTAFDRRLAALLSGPSFAAR